MRKTLIIFALIIAQIANAQFLSIHNQENEYYKTLGTLTSSQYDSINKNILQKNAIKDDFTLNKRVFGYHPYWMGNSWQNYNWQLLSDICYFSYELDPSTGYAKTTHEWNTTPLIDTAIANNVNVHICVTLFSNHNSFLTSELAQENFIKTIIVCLKKRNATGVNIDFEAVPASLKDNFTNFIKKFSIRLKDSIPNSELSLAAPAVNWSNTFNLSELSPYIDFFMIMTYDYYYNYSSIAGPISGLYPLTSSFNYSVVKTVNYYQQHAVPESKIVIGAPYYGRDWPVEGNFLGAPTTGTATVLTYKAIRNNNYTYNSSVLQWDSISYNDYYCYFINNRWQQCFFDNDYSLSLKYDLINKRNLAGIGIWALGYDNGYNDLWETIANYFTNKHIVKHKGDLFDSGGPIWDYGNNENYTETINTYQNENITLLINYIELEEGVDSLFIFDGNSTSAPLLAKYSNNVYDKKIETNSGIFTIKFKSNNYASKKGYWLEWRTKQYDFNDNNIDDKITIYPNPIKEYLNIKINNINFKNAKIAIFNLKGETILKQNIYIDNLINLKHLKKGFYILQVVIDDKTIIKKILLH